MTAHLALRYVPLGTVAVTGPDAVAVGESSVPLRARRDPDGAGRCWRR